MQPGKIWLIFELNTGTHWKINFWKYKADVPDFISVYENEFCRGAAHEAYYDSYSHYADNLTNNCWMWERF